MSTPPTLLSAENSLLVVVDLQAKLSTAMPESDAELMTTNIGILLDTATILNIPVLLTEQYPKGLGPTVISIAEKLPETTRIFDKTGFSCCAANGFCKALENSGRQQIILAGQEAHVCVLQTALELVHVGYQVYIVEDAVCSRNTKHKFYALQRLQQHGITITNH
ncbi:MAG: isochorismatase family protein, partial [Methylobacter sp.]